MEDTVINNKNVKFLCRICLTSTKNLTPLTSSVNEQISNIKNSWTVQKMLETVTFNKVVIDETKFPSNICPMCLSLLKISYEFQLQFMKSQKILKRVTDEMPVEKLLNIEPEESEGRAPKAPVELIFCGNSFDLKDVIVVEEEDSEKSSFEGFLRNLGNEISARFVDHDYKATKPQPQPENEVVIEQLSSQRDDAVLIEEVNVFTDLDDEKIVKTLYECDTCRQLFETCEELQGHMISCYKPALQLVCDKCGHVAHSQSALYHHLQKHKGKRFKCSQCDKSFVTTSRLKVHLEVHKNERPYLCSVCGKDFNYAVALNYHMRLHTGEKKYVCNYCGLKYRMPNTLKRHLRTHTNDRPYRCRYCPYSFPSKGEVKCHEMVHTGDRPYKCEYCDKGFTKSSSLQYHHLSHPGPHECFVCPKTFLEVKFLKLHLQRVHKLDDEGYADET